jgi:hypothetical protein
VRATSDHKSLIRGVVIHLRIDALDYTINQECSLVIPVLILVVTVVLFFRHLRLRIFDQVIHSKKFHDISLHSLVFLWGVCKNPDRRVFGLGVAVVILVTHLVHSVQCVHPRLELRVVQHFFAAGASWLRDKVLTGAVLIVRLEVPGLAEIRSLLAERHAAPPSAEHQFLLMQEIDLLNRVVLTSFHCITLD